MVKAFEIAGYGEQTVVERFGGMYRAFHYGAPPHGGMAAGVDRIVMLLAGEQNLREVALFPMNQRAEDLLMGAPSPATAKQLRELHIRTNLPESVNGAAFYSLPGSPPFAAAAWAKKPRNVSRNHSAPCWPSVNQARRKPSGENFAASAITRFSISAITAACIGWTSGRPMNWRASTGVQSISIVTFIVAPSFAVRTPCCSIQSPPVVDPAHRLGERTVWASRQSYWRDFLTLRFAPLRSGALRFSDPAPATNARRNRGPASAPQRPSAAR